MKSIKKVTLILFILFSCAGCDQTTKIVARHNLSETRVVTFLHDTIRLQYIENQGAFLGVGSTIPTRIRSILLVFFVGVFLFSMLIFLLMQNHFKKNQIISLSLVLGGGFGNLIDRILNQGRVVDFMNIGIGSLRTGIFNVADVAITFGIIWYFIISLKNQKNEFPFA
jgi:signal peptidase II